VVVHISTVSKYMKKETMNYEMSQLKIRYVIVNSRKLYLFYKEVIF